MSEAGAGFRGEAEATIRRYYEGCNEADAEKMLSCLSPAAVHYFPAGAPQGPFIGADAIAQGWCEAVASLGSKWVMERLAIDESNRTAVLEWTHYKPKQATFLRGDEWFEFDENGLISEIRAYYAAPPAGDPRNYELGGFDYARRGYSLVDSDAALPRS